MKVLWVCNSKPSGLEQSEKSIDNGGWMTGILNQLVKERDVAFYIVYPGAQTSELVACGNIRFRSLASCRNKLKYDTIFAEEIRNVLKEEEFDCIHIWGTEYPHTLATIDVCDSLGMCNKTLIWIQGLCHIYAEHYYASLPDKVTRGYTFRDLIKKDNLYHQKEKFVIRGRFEIEAIQKCQHICGRTEWDYITTKLINPDAKYHFCNEVMRNTFYDVQWDIKKCQRGRIFTSQATYPIKGLHNLLRAVELIRKKYPYVEVYVAGEDVTFSQNKRSKIRIGSYGWYLKRYIKKHELESCVHFTGPLSAEEMVEQYLQANVFVLPSAIENSPNSLGEAMLVGTPCIASDVGGVRNMLEHCKEGFVYSADEIYMMAGYLMKLMSDDTLAMTISEAARVHANATHDRKVNAKRLIEIYNELEES